MLVCLFKTAAVKSYEMFLFLKLHFSLIFKNNTCFFLSDFFKCYFTTHERKLSHFCSFKNKMRS